MGNFTEETHRLNETKMLTVSFHQETWYRWLFTKKWVPSGRHLWPRFGRLKENSLGCIVEETQDKQPRQNCFGRTLFNQNAESCQQHILYSNFYCVQHCANPWMVEIGKGTTLLLVDMEVLFWDRAETHTRNRISVKYLRNQEIEGLFNSRAQ